MSSEEEEFHFDFDNDENIVQLKEKLRKDLIERMNQLNNDMGNRNSRNSEMLANLENEYKKEERKIKKQIRELEKQIQNLGKQNENSSLQDEVNELEELSRKLQECIDANSEKIKQKKNIEKELKRINSLNSDQDITTVKKLLDQQMVDFNDLIEDTESKLKRFVSLKRSDDQTVEKLIAAVQEKEAEIIDHIAKEEKYK